MAGLTFVYLSYSLGLLGFHTLLLTPSYTLPAAVLTPPARLRAAPPLPAASCSACSAAHCSSTSDASDSQESSRSTSTHTLIPATVSGTVRRCRSRHGRRSSVTSFPPERLDGGIALFGSLAAAAALIGAVAGGFLLGVIGASAVFALNAASFVPQMVVIARLHPKERPPQPPTHHDLRRALRVIRTDPKLRLGFQEPHCGQPLAAPLFKLLPAIAEQVDAGAHILGLLTAMVSLGGMAVAGAMVRLRRRYGRGLVVMMGMLVPATALIGLGISNVFLDGYALFPAGDRRIDRPRALRWPRRRRALVARDVGRTEELRGIDLRRVRHRLHGNRARRRRHPRPSV